MGVNAIGMVKVDHPEGEVVVFGFRDGEEGRNQCRARDCLLQLLFNVQVMVLEVG